MISWISWTMGAIGCMIISIGIARFISHRDKFLLAIAIIAGVSLMGYKLALLYSNPDLRWITIIGGMASSVLLILYNSPQRKNSTGRR